jgi:hypothetical protein
MAKHQTHHETPHDTHKLDREVKQKMTDRTYDALAGRNIKDLSESERQALLAQFRKPPALPPIDMSKKAKEMTEAEREIWWANLRRRFQ